MHFVCGGGDTESAEERSDLFACYFMSFLTREVTKHIFRSDIFVKKKRPVEEPTQEMIMVTFLIASIKLQ